MYPHCRKQDTNNMNRIGIEGYSALHGEIRGGRFSGNKVMNN